VSEGHENVSDLVFHRTEETYFYAIEDGDYAQGYDTVHEDSFVEGLEFVQIFMSFFSICNQKIALRLEGDHRPDEFIVFEIVIGVECWQGIVKYTIGI
jgi:hypothetical protein